MDTLSTFLESLTTLLTKQVGAIRNKAVRTASGLASLLRLLGVGLTALVGEETLRERLTARLTDPINIRHIFNVLRAFAPILVLKRRVVTAYENSGTAIVTRDQDVREVLDQHGAFHVVYGSKMAKITDGGEFFLGMQNSRVYDRDVSNMRAAATFADVDAKVRPFAASEALNAVQKADGRIDVPQELSLPLLARLVGDYFGTPGPTSRSMIDWTTRMFWYLFTDLQGDADVEARALEAAAECRDYLDAAIAQRKQNPRPTEDVLGRCLELQAGGTPGMSDADIRNNLLGLLIGFVPTISAACTQALDQLLERPEELSLAQAAARSDDDERLEDYVLEALRFNPVNPILYRLATRDYSIARGTRREKQIPEGTMVLASNLSAMFDPDSVEDPNSFQVDRPWSTYILFGYGMHRCFGEEINRAVIPQILKPLLCQTSLRRSAGDAGRINMDGTPFPMHLVVEYQPS